MIRRDRNHPSILMWSMGNETNCAADGAWARAEDDTRIVHFRHVYGGRGEDEPHNPDQIDMENLLRCTIRGWYTRAVKDAEPPRILVLDGDIANDCIEKMVQADGIIRASPTYFADVTREMKALVDRAGFVAGDPDVVDQLIGLRKHLGMMVPSPVQAAIVAGLGDQAHACLRPVHHVHPRHRDGGAPE